MKPTVNVKPTAVQPQALAAPSLPAAPVALPVVVAPAAEAEVVAMLTERTSATAEQRAVASQLLAAGYTVTQVARRLKVREVTVWGWTSDPDVKAAVEAGREHRRKVLGQGLEVAAADALTALSDIVSDSSVMPRDRLKAAELILDRAGLTDRPAAAASVQVDVSFDERLARIAASATGKP
jgi:hypothetical protein